MAGCAEEGIDMGGTTTGPAAGPSEMGAASCVGLCAAGEGGAESQLERDGLYGPVGWTEKAGLAALLDPEGKGPGWGGITRFEHLTGGDVAALRAALPPEQLDDRQNEAPSLGALLAAGEAHPGGVMLSGYWVRTPRLDERVSVDGLLVRATACGAAPESVRLGRREVWEWLHRVLDLGECGEPDELSRWLFADDGMLGWWLWWD